MKTTLILLILLATQGISGLYGEQTEGSSDLIKVELPGKLDYRYAGFIAAVEKGFFKQAGFNVELSFGSTKADIQQRVLSGETAYSVCGSEILIDHYYGLPFVATATYFQNTDVTLVMAHNDGDSKFLTAKTGSRIVFENTKPIEILNMFAKDDLTEEDFNIDYQPENKIQRFEDGEIDGFESYFMTDNYEMKDITRSFHTYNPEHFGVEMYDQVLYTSRSFVQEHRSKIVAFREAVSEGWKFALANNVEMVDILTEKYKVDLSRAYLMHQHWTVENKLILPNLISIGSYKATRWDRIKDLYVKFGLLPKNYIPGDFYFKKEKAQEGFFKEYFKEIIIIAVVITFVVIVLVMMNRKLVRMVDRRTMELAEVNWQLSKFNEELESKIQKRTIELEKALKNTEVASKAKSTFLANMTHEIRTPMNSILGFAQIMREKTLDRDMIKYLDTINSSGQNLLRIINDVLDLSRVESGKFSLDYSRFNILRLIEESMNMFSEEIQAKNISLKFDHSDECPEYIYLDKDRLRQVLTNVIGNAVKFTEEGLIEVKLSLEMVSPKDADISIEVKDTGIGIPEKNLESIFGEFEQVDNVHLNYGGTGLGLAISKRLVEMMGGALSVKSEEGRGSDFKIKLNKVGIVDKEDERVESKKQQYHFEPAKVMVVDECQLTRDLFEAYLSVTRLTIRTYSSAFDAVNDLTAFKPDLVITEINLRSMDGFQLVEEIHQYEEFKQTPVIAISSITHTGSRQKFRVFNGFLKKPISVNDFYQSISHFLPCKVIVKNQQVKEVSVKNSNTRQEGLSFTKFLNKEIRDKCADIMKYQVINDYKNLYRILKCIEEEKGLKDLKHWLEEYQKNLDVFNFEALNRQIEYLMNSKDSTHF